MKQRGWRSNAVIIGGLLLAGVLIRAWSKDDGSAAPPSTPCAQHAPHQEVSLAGPAAIALTQDCVQRLLEQCPGGPEARICEVVTQTFGDAIVACQARELGLAFGRSAR